jgi:hypothetical protein
MVRRATALEAPSVSALIVSGLRAWHDLIPIGWRFRRIGVDLVRGLARDGRVFVTQDSSGAGIAAAGRGTTVLAALVGSPAQRRLLVDSVVEQGSAERVAIFAPDRSTVSDLGVAVEPHAWCPEGLVIVEKSLGR